MIALKQITETEIFVFIAIQVFKLLSSKILFIVHKKKKMLKSRLLFRKRANFKGTLLQNYK